jgi:hypothetical protein
MKKDNLQKRFAVCIDNSGYEVSLEGGKIYRVLEDPAGTDHGYLRVIDESGEDYLFDSERFFPTPVYYPAIACAFLAGVLFWLKRKLGGTQGVD